MKSADLIIMLNQFIIKSYSNHSHRTQELMDDRKCMLNPLLSWHLEEEEEDKRKGGYLTRSKFS